MRRQARLTVFAVVGALGFSLADQAYAESVVGAGATFPAPVYAKWAESYYQATNNKVNYQSIGSGAGIQQIDAKTVDFGASDMPQKDDVLTTKKEIQFPMVLGGVVPVVNLKNVGIGQLKLTGSILADIYLGKITKWNDPEIGALNPGLELPNEVIAVVRRADGSGTSFIFTNYLSKVSPGWKDKVGEGTAVNWPIGVGGKGNEGVAAFVSRLPYSIGYIEYAYAMQGKMNYVQLQNAAGQFVKPTTEAFKSASTHVDWDKSFYQILTNQPGKETWPMSGASFILLHKVQDNPEKAKTVLKFFNWAYANGDKQAEALNYVPIPSPLVKKIEQLWSASLTTKDGKPIPYN